MKTKKSLFGRKVSIGLAAILMIGCMNPSNLVYSQNIGINITGTLPDASAMLDVSSSNQGLLIPRVSLTSTTDVVTIASPAASLLVYNTNAAMTGGSVGYWYWDGTQWAQLGAGGGSGWLLTGNAGTTAGTNFIGTTDAQDWVIKTNNAERMRILSGGNVGIGTTNPSYKVQINNTVGTTVYGFDSDGGGYPRFRLGGSSAGVAYVINRITPGATSYFGEGADGGGYQFRGNGAFQVLDETSTKFYVDPNGGNVGIGTTSPGAKLHIAGASGTTIKIVDGNQAAGKVLTSDAAGQGSWQPATTSCILGDVVDFTSNPGGIDACNYWVSPGFGELRFFCHNDGWDAGSSEEKMILRCNPSDGLAGAKSTDLVFRGRDISNQLEDITNIRGVLTNHANGTEASALEFFTRTGGGALTERMRINDVGNVGIGTTAPVYKLQLSTNSAAKPTSTAWTVPSDERLKRDIRPFTQGLDAVKQINPIWFKYNGKGGISMEEGGVGAMAQDIEKIAPYMIKPFQYTDTISGATTTYMGVDYGALDFILVNAIKEQQKIIDNLKTENQTMQSDIETLKMTVKKLSRQNTETSEK